VTERAVPRQHCASFSLNVRIATGTASFGWFVRRSQTSQLYRVTQDHVLEEAFCPALPPSPILAESPPPPWLSPRPSFHFYLTTAISNPLLPLKKKNIHPRQTKYMLYPLVAKQLKHLQSSEWLYVITSIKKPLVTRVRGNVNWNVGRRNSETKCLVQWQFMAEQNKKTTLESRHHIYRQRNYSIASAVWKTRRVILHET